MQSPDIVATALANPVDQKRKSDAERPTLGPDGSLFLAGHDCKPNETLAPGHLPTCEPTCADPLPMCPKIFFEGTDYVPCFCNKPLVRNKLTKECVPLAECPQQPPQLEAQKV